MEKRSKITKGMTIGEVIKKHPKSVFVFIDYGLHCVGCPMAEPETIEEAAKLHRINLEKFLKDLNKITKRK
jgi:hybrid cluster-associated redox disulfide protein